MNTTNKILLVGVIRNLLALAIVLAWAIAPMPSLGAEPKDYKGYLGDGIPEAGEDETEELARAAQNPLASMISVPFQNNTSFRFGPRAGTLNVMNIQPVVPFKLSERLNLITRTILPIISQPGLLPGQGRENGLGDTLFSAWVSPRGSQRLIWGVGPAVLLPTSTSERLGAGEFGLGPTVVALTMPGRWVIGSLLNNVWGLTRNRDVNTFTWQYFLNYNLDRGWYLTSQPIITANWNADNANRWTVPVGGGVGRVFRIGKLPINANFHGYYNAVKPDNIGPEWSLRFTLQFMFPKR
jgi:hypothetical protein